MAVAGEAASPPRRGWVLSGGAVTRGVGPSCTETSTAGAELTARGLRRRSALAGCSGETPWGAGGGGVVGRGAVGGLGLFRARGCRAVVTGGLG